MTSPARHLRFGDFELQLPERRLLRSGQPVPLGARAFDVLSVLAQAGGRLVTKNQLLDLVWPGLVVEEANVQVQVSALRKAVGSGVVATIPGLGYQFTAPLDEPAPRPAPATETATRPLPRAADPLIGRARDLAEVGTLLRTHRLVTLVGTGGVGKTRLALALAHGDAATTLPCVGWLGLSELRSGDSIAPALAAACGLRLTGPGTEPALLAALAVREGLLVVDNCEHLIDEVAALLPRLLAAAPALHVLATSRRVLHLADEQVHRLQPLQLPPQGASLDDARHFAALQLLETRAAAADRRFVLSSDDLPQAIELCRKLDGLPLAIEMAAARVPLLGLATLCRQLSDAAAQTDPIRNLQRDAPPRQRSLHGVLDWSHALLAPGEAQLLRRLALFVGSFSLDAALQLATDDSFDEANAIDALQGLIDHSLVKLEQVDPPRYRLLETTKAYAHQRLAGAGEEALLLRRHGEVMCRVAERLLDRHRERPPLATQRADYADLAFAFEQACSRCDGDRAAALVIALRTIDQACGLMSASGPRLPAAARMLSHAGVRGQARLHGVIASCGWVDVHGHPRAEAAQRAAAAWRELGDALGLHGALCVLATETARLGRHEAAEAALHEARALEAADWPRRAVVLRSIHEGWVADLCGDLPRCRESFERAVALSEQESDHATASGARVWLAWVVLAMGETGPSISMCRQILGEMAADGASDDSVHVATTLAQGLLIEGATEDARQALATIWAPSAQAFRDGLRDWVNCTALLAACDGALDDAARLLGHAAALQDRGMPTRDPVADRIVQLTRERIDAALPLERSRALQAEGACANDASLQAMLKRRASRS